MRLKQSHLEVIGGCLGDRISGGWFRAFVSVYKGLPNRVRTTYQPIVILIAYYQMLNSYMPTPLYLEIGRYVGLFSIEDVQLRLLCAASEYGRTACCHST
jgi:hypothetical protein